MMSESDFDIPCSQMANNQCDDGFSQEFGGDVMIMMMRIIIVLCLWKMEMYKSMI